MERTNVTILFANIRTSKSTYYLLFDKSHSKTHTTKFHFQFFCYKFWLHQLKNRKNRRLQFKNWRKQEQAQKIEKKKELNTPRLEHTCSSSVPLLFTLYRIAFHVGTKSYLVTDILLCHFGVRIREVLTVGTWFIAPSLVFRLFIVSVQSHQLQLQSTKHC